MLKLSGLKLKYAGTAIQRISSREFELDTQAAELKLADLLAKQAGEVVQYRGLFEHRPFLVHFKDVGNRHKQ
jgi:hypothetical protein